MTIVNAQYQRDGIPEIHRGNPLIEALPIVPDYENLFARLQIWPKIDLQASKLAPFHVRSYDIDVLDQMFVPSMPALTYASMVDKLIRKSYLDRNPLDVGHVKYLYGIPKLLELLESQGACSPTLAGIITAKGPSGMGKTRTSRMIFSAYPQVIQHTLYDMKPLVHAQVVWLTVDAPIGGAMKEFVVSLFRALDEALGLNAAESYANKIKDTQSYPKLLTLFAQAAARYSLGILHVDDIQRIAETGTDKEHVMQIMIRLANVAKCGLVFSGTRSIEDLIWPSIADGKKRAHRNQLLHEKEQQVLEITRRIISAGFIEFSRPTSAADPFYRLLVQRLLEYQWLDEPLLPSEELYSLLYELSQAIPAVLVLLYKSAQSFALMNGATQLTFEHFRRVHDQSIGPLGASLAQIGRNSPPTEEALRWAREAVKATFKKAKG